MVTSIVGCGSLFGVVLVGELVVGCVSFCVILFTAVGMGNCGLGVSSIIVCDSDVLCDVWSFCCADSFCSSTSVVVRLSVICWSGPPPGDVGSFWEAFFCVGASICLRSSMVGNVSGVLFWLVCVTVFFRVAFYLVLFCHGGRRGWGGVCGSGLLSRVVNSSLSALRSGLGGRVIC